MDREIYTHSFPTQRLQNIFTCQLDNVFKMNEDLIAVIYSTGDKQDHKTNVKAYMTDWNMEDGVGFKELSKISLEIASIISQAQYKRDTNLGIKDMWGMIYKDGNYALAHDHWPSVWSGVYYIQCPNTLTGGELHFSELKQKITPKENMLVLFDGCLKHGVKKVIGRGERIAVSFNVYEKTI